MASVTGRSRIWNAFTNWRFVLLGATGLVLSIASGWTTWDGMRNFTDEPILSLMITFGIQGVMLIVAWLIGESFATGMVAKRTGKGGQINLKRMRVIVMGCLFVCVIGALSVVLLYRLGIVSGSFAASPFANWSGRITLALIGLLALCLLLMSAGRDIFERYVQTGRIMIRSLALWLMFLACMGTSVFFSFDSLFSTIFPADERERAAQLRGRSEVATVISSISDLTAQRRLEERSAVLRSAAWREYAGKLEALGSELRVIPTALEGKVSEIEKARRKSEAKRKAQIGAIEEERDQLDDREEDLREDLELAQEQVASSKAAITDLNKKIFAKEREVIAQAAATEAEASGIGVTARRGRGPQYRALARELRNLQEQKNNLYLQLREYRRATKKSNASIASIGAELAEIKTRRAGLPEAPERSAKGKDAAQRLTQLKAIQGDAGKMLGTLAKERIAFEQNPTRAGLDALQARCTAIVDRFGAVKGVKTSLSKATCDPGRAHEAAAQLYALSSGAVAVARSCAGPTNLPKADSLDEQVRFGRSCLQMSRLSKNASASIRADLNALERDRDDKAHRFVVSLNAFGDGNRLAYLALAIAFAIDALVFVSGLFGANAVRSRLTDLPDAEGRTARQLETIVESALLPDVYRSTSTALENLRPVDVATGDALTQVAGSGWTHEISLGQRMPTRVHNGLRRLLNAGMTIGAVRRDSEASERYFLRAELVEFLNETAGRTMGRSGGQASAIQDAIMMSLQPDPARHIETVLRYVRPSSESADYSAQIVVGDVKRRHLPVVLRCLNAGSAEQLVKGVGKAASYDRYLLHRDFYRGLISMAAGLDDEPASALELEDISGRSVMRVADMPSKLPPSTEVARDAGVDTGRRNEPDTAMGLKGEADDSERSDRSHAEIEAPSVFMQLATEIAETAPVPGLAPKRFSAAGATAVPVLPKTGLSSPKLPHLAWGNVIGTNLPETHLIRSGGNSNLPDADAWPQANGQLAVELDEVTSAPRVTSTTNADVRAEARPLPPMPAPEQPRLLKRPVRDTRSVEAQSRPAKSLPAQSPQAQTKSVSAKSVSAKPAQAKPAQAKSVSAKPKPETVVTSTQADAPPRRVASDTIVTSNVTSKPATQKPEADKPDVDSEFKIEEMFSSDTLSFD